MSTARVAVPFSFAITLILFAFDDVRSQDMGRLSEPVTLDLSISPAANAPIERLLSSAVHDEIRIKSTDHNLNSTFAITRKQSYIKGYLSLLAVDGEGRSLMLTTSENGVHGMLIQPDSGQELVFRSARDGGAWSQSVVHDSPQAASSVLGDHEACGNELHEEDLLNGLDELRRRFPPDVEGSLKPKASAVTGFSPPLLHARSMTDAPDDSIVIDLMAVYTEAAAVRAVQSGHASFEEGLAASMIKSQGVLDLSKLPIRLRLVHVHKTSYDEQTEGGSNYDHLFRLTIPGDGYMDEVHAKRDSSGADLIIGLFDLVGSTAGIGWLLNTPEGWPLVGVSLTDGGVLTRRFTLMHEIGHNMGLNHSRSQRAQRAEPQGGVFHYSTGYRWKGDSGSYHSVMAYQLSGETSAPIYASPSILWDGAPSGSMDGPYAPSDARRSQLEMRRVIASYRPTQVDPPVMELGSTRIDAVLGEEEELDVTLPIVNSGASTLSWRMELVPVTSLTRRLPGAASDESASRSSIREHYSIPLSIPPALAYGLVSDGPMIFTDDFETGKDSVFIAYREWRSPDLTTYTSSVATLNPSGGERHLRLAPQGTDYTLRSPFFGPQPSGAFDIEFDLAVTLDETGRMDRFAMVGIDNSGTLVSSGIAVGGEGELQVFEEAAESGAAFTGTGRFFTSGEYVRLRIRYDRIESQIEYSMDGEIVAVRPFSEAAGLDYFLLTLFNDGNTGTRVDLDSITVLRPHASPWLDSPVYAGSLSQGESGEITLRLRSHDVYTGTYTADLRLATNDPAASLVTVPIELTAITQSDPGSDGSHRPDTLDLATTPSPGYRLMSAPVRSPDLTAFLAPLASTAPLRVFAQDENLGWLTPVEDLSAFDPTPGQGFMVRMTDHEAADGSDDAPDSLVTLFLTGLVETEDVRIQDIQAKEWRLLGNPYRRPLDWSQVETSDLGRSVQVWSGDRDGGPAYDVWNGVPGVGFNGVIKPFQGFWVHGRDLDENPATTGSVTMSLKHTHLVADVPDVQVEPAQSGFIRITVREAGRDDDAYLTFASDGDYGRDPRDAVKLTPLTLGATPLLAIGDVQAASENLSRRPSRGTNSTAPNSALLHSIQHLPYATERDTVVALSLHWIHAQPADPTPDQLEPVRSPGRAGSGAERPGTRLQNRGELTWSMTGMPDHVEPYLVDPVRGLRVSMRSDSVYRMQQPHLSTVSLAPFGTDLLSQNPETTAYDGSGGSHLRAERAPDTLAIDGAAVQGLRIELRYSSSGAENDRLNKPSLEQPLALQLAPSHPNPFNPQTTIRFALPEDARIRLEVLDVVGRRVMELENGSTLYKAGWHSVHLHAGSLPSGVYFYRLQALGQQQVRSFTLLR